VSEVVLLKVADIDIQRIVIRVEQGRAFLSLPQNERLLALKRLFETAKEPGPQRRASGGAAGP
jgi:hypothetical protein